MFLFIFSIDEKTNQKIWAYKIPPKIIAHPLNFRNSAEK
jgi:hypothetical protein